MAIKEDLEAGIRELQEAVDDVYALPDKLILDVYESVYGTPTSPQELEEVRYILWMGCILGRDRSEFWESAIDRGFVPKRYPNATNLALQIIGSASF